jgi:hypothetical protein
VSEVTARLMEAEQQVTFLYVLVSGLFRYFGTAGSALGWARPMNPARVPCSSWNGSMTRSLK